jgi:NADH-quinone oxidoreductase subunit E
VKLIGEKREKSKLLYFCSFETGTIGTKCSSEGDIINMKRYDLRGLKADFIPRLVELMNSEITTDENGIFIFEIGDFSNVQAVADSVKENNWTLMNSIKFNEVDWTVVVKKTAPEVPETSEASEDATSE